MALTRGLDRVREFEKSPVANHSCCIANIRVIELGNLLNQTHPGISTRAITALQLAFLVYAVNLLRLLDDIFAQQFGVGLADMTVARAAQTLGESSSLRCVQN